MTQANFTNFEGKNLYDKDGEKIGTFKDLYLDDESEEPKWATVSSGLFGQKHHFMPLAGVTQHEDGYQTLYSKATILSAPSIEADEYLSADEEDRLYSHFPASGTDEADMKQQDKELSEDRSQHEPGRMRLRKYVVLSKTEVAVPMEEISDTQLGDADDSQVSSAPKLSADEQAAVQRSQQTAADKNNMPHKDAKPTRNNVQRQEPAFGEVQNDGSTDQRPGSYRADIDGEEQ